MLRLLGRIQLRASILFGVSLVDNREQLCLSVSGDLLAQTLFFKGTPAPMNRSNYQAVALSTGIVPERAESSHSLAHRCPQHGILQLVDSWIHPDDFRISTRVSAS